MALKSELLSPSRRLQQASEGPPSIKPFPSVEDQDAVTRIQQALIKLGHLPADFGQNLLSGEILGFFGKTTENAVKAFQKEAFPNAPNEWDGKVGKGTLAKLDARLMGDGPKPVPPEPDGFTDLKVLRFRQTLPAGPGSPLSYPAIEPASVIPFLFAPVARDAALVEGAAVGTISEFLFKIEKNGAIFWVGASVPAGTTDFSRAHIFFHPDTISDTDDRRYTAFTGRWQTVRQTYVVPLGLQMAAVKAMPLIVPFMTFASRTNDSRTNLFADRGSETLDDILAAIQISLGRTDAQGTVWQIGVSSFSSGVNHLFRFAQKVGATGFIREQIDFDSAHMIVAHKTAPPLLGAVNWMVTQSPPPSPGRVGWLYLPERAFRNVNTMRGDRHKQIGLMMFKAMMTLSIIR